ncbi:hypothetical protein L1987_09456 [Smallanthus sonchifolius]|uniref:Uncharacterized protein n=1 Tax=Smallanthus sonchifolius TaxID=185202 RepID=A0ACB9JPK7_9ASTR|nr:hypothetical protein L1987_09456 [Smallanthus sonchifolius]
MDNKIELLVQQYEQFNVDEHEKVDEGYARFNIIVTSFKPLVKKEKVKSLALKAKHSKSSSEEDNEKSNSDNGEEFATAKDKSKDERRCFRFVDLNHFIQDCPNPPSKDNKNNAFVGGAWNDSGDENDEAKEDKCLIPLAQMSEILDDLLKAQNPSNEKSGLGFSNDTNVASTSKTKPTTFVKAKNVEVDRNILLKAKAKVAQTRKVSIEKPQVVKQFNKPKQGPRYVKDNYPRQVSRSYNSYLRRNNN